MAWGSQGWPRSPSSSKCAQIPVTASVCLVLSVCLSVCLLPEARTLSYRVSLAGALISARITSETLLQEMEAKTVFVLQKIMNASFILCVLIH